LNIKKTARVRSPRGNGLNGLKTKDKAGENESTENSKWYSTNILMQVLPWSLLG